MKYLFTAFSTTLLLCVSSSLSFADTDDKPEPIFQYFLGALKLEDQNANWADVSDGNANVDFKVMPSAGVEAEYAFHEGWVHWGLNSGGSVAYSNGDTDISGRLAGPGGTSRTQLDNSLLLLEVHMGGYIRGRLNSRITTYAAAGPLLMYGIHEIDDELLIDAAGNRQGDPQLAGSNDASSLNLGYYARAGIDFEIRENQHLGVGFRYMASELDFNDTIGNLDIQGPQFVFTFSKKM